MTLAEQRWSAQQAKSAANVPPRNDLFILTKVLMEEGYRYIDPAFQGSSGPSIGPLKPFDLEEFREAFEAFCRDDFLRTQGLNR